MNDAQALGDQMQRGNEVIITRRTFEAVAGAVLIPPVELATAAP